MQKTKSYFILLYLPIFFFFCFSTVLKESGYNNIYFRIKEIRILFDFCTECNQTQRIFLEEFTKMDTSAFCLAHIFTFRDFPAGIQGLAYKGQVCSRSHNTGFTTFLNHKVSILMLKGGVKCKLQGKKFMKSLLNYELKIYFFVKSFINRCI